MNSASTRYSTAATSLSVMNAVSKSEVVGVASAVWNFF